MDRGGGEAALGQLVGDLGDGALGAAEDHRQAAALGLQHAGQQLDLVHRVGPVDELLDGGDGRAVVGRVDGPDVGRLGHVAAGQGDDRARHGGREEHGLPRVGRQREHPLDVGQEAQVEHLVGLVQHDGPDVAELQVALLGQVEQPARGADDDLDALAQRLDLRLVGPAAVDGEHPDAALVAGGLEVARHLDGELAGRHDDERLRLAGGRQRVEPLVAGSEHQLQQRDAEAEGLAGAGLGLADDVVPGQRDRQGHGLDREGMDDAGVGQGGDDVRVHVEISESTVFDHDEPSGQSGGHTLVRSHSSAGRTCCEGADRERFAADRASVVAWSLPGGD